MSDEDFAKVPTYSDVFWEIFNSKGYKIPDNHTNYCFMFELTLVSSVV
jgi:hypothetical protein